MIYIDAYIMLVSFKELKKNFAAEKLADTILIKRPKLTSPVMGQIRIAFLTTECPRHTNREAITGKHIGRILKMIQPCAELEIHQELKSQGSAEQLFQVERDQREIITKST